jgi:enamine deaminase RidA (YjgF/YER057c/UK114 family)
MQIVHPKDWPQAREYVHGIIASGKTLFIAGQIGARTRDTFESDDMGEQAAVALRNVVAVLAEAGAKPDQLTRLTWYVTSMDEYRAAARAIGAAYLQTIGQHRPVMSLVEVRALVAPRAKIEIEATAVLESF